MGSGLQETIQTNYFSKAVRYRAPAQSAWYTIQGEYEHSAKVSVAKFLCKENATEFLKL